MPADFCPGCGPHFIGRCPHEQRPFDEAVFGDPTALTAEDVERIAALMDRGATVPAALRASPLLVTVAEFDGDIAFLDVEWMAGPCRLHVNTDDLPPDRRVGDRLVVTFTKETSRAR